MIPLDPRLRWPEIAFAFDAARTLGLAVAQGRWTLRDAHAHLMGLPLYSFWEKNGGITGGAARTSLAWALRDAVREYELKRFFAEEAVIRALAPVLAAGGDRAAMAQASRAADAQDVLTSDERRAIAETEAAWWLRLHASLPDGVRDAA